jgi:hypothetical protein
VARFRVGAGRAGHAREAGRFRFRSAHESGIAMSLLDIEEATRLVDLPLWMAARTEPGSDFSDWLFTKNDYYRDPDARPNLTALQNNIKTRQKVGLLNIDVAVAQYADLSPADEAVQRRHR